jgi:hypothetical protein
MNKKQTFIIMGIVTLLAGVGMLSTALAVFAGPPGDSMGGYSYSRSYGGRNINTNTNTNTVRVDAGPTLAYAVPGYSQSYGYPPVPAYVPPPQYIPQPVAQTPYYQYTYAPGIPNAGIGDVGKINLGILVLSGICALVGSLYVFRTARTLA